MIVAGETGTSKLEVQLLLEIGADLFSGLIGADADIAQVSLVIELSQQRQPCLARFQAEKSVSGGENFSSRTHGA